MAENESLGTDHALPFERARKSPAEVSKSLSAALESDLSDEAEGADEPAADEGATPDEAEPEEEASGDDAEPEEEDADEEPEEEDTEEPAAETLFEVQGEKVTLQGLKDGWLRQADYTRKTQAVAEQRRKAETAEVEARTQRDRYAERLQALTLALEEIAPPKRDWAKLRAENPTEYAVAWAEHQQHQEKLTAAQMEQRRVYEERLADHQRQQEAYLEEQKGKLHEAIPEWKDQKVEQAEKEKLADYLMGTYGWTRDDLETVSDHRLMVALRKSMLYDEGQKNGKAKIAGKIKPATKPLQPGARERAPRRAAKTDLQRARKRLARSGGVEAGAEVIKRLVDLT